MLAYPYEPKRLAQWAGTGPGYGYIQPKLDGIRCRTVLLNGTATLLSSEENEFHSLPTLSKILSAFSSHYGRDLELDGELYLSNGTFQRLCSLVKRNTPSEEEFLVEYHIFDVLDPFDEALDQESRLELRQKVFESLSSMSEFCSEFIREVPTFKVFLEEDYIDPILANFIEAGYEGFILRKADAPYYRKRTTTMLKMKPRKEDSYKIVGFEEEISIEGKPKAALGSLLLTDGTGARFSVGTGSFLTRDMRIALWVNRSELIGRTATIKYQELTSDRRVPRFPALISIS